MKTVTQIDLTITDEPGMLLGVSDLLSANGINIIALYLVKESDQGRLYFIADDPEKAVNVLRTAGYEADTGRVTACVVPSHPGGLNAVLRPLKAAGINVNYIYPCIGTGETKVLIIGIEQIEEAIRIFEDNWVQVLGTELYHM